MKISSGVNMIQKRKKEVFSLNEEAWMVVVRLLKSGNHDQYYWCWFSIFDILWKLSWMQAVLTFLQVGVLFQVSMIKNNDDAEKNA